LLNKNEKTSAVFWLSSCVYSFRMSVELLIGRGLAFCVHPTAAWRVTSARGRAFVLAAYAGAGYLGVLAALLLA
jgi:hypothetical protein